MSSVVVRFPFPREATVHDQLLMFSTEREFRKKLNIENIPSDAIREVFRIWALCFRAASQTRKDDRISIKRFLYAADFSVVRLQHEYESRYHHPSNTMSDIERRNKVSWYWMLVVARRIFCKRYKGFLDEILRNLVSREFCVCLITWDPSWMDEIQNKWDT